MRNRHAIIITIAFLAFAPLSKSAVQADRVFEHIKLQLRPVVDSAQKIDKTQFGPTDAVTVQVLAINSGSKQVTFAYWKLLVHYLPTLTKAGEVVPYSKAMEERIAAMEERIRRAAEPDFHLPDSASIVNVAPNQISQAGLIELSYYYDKLQPGIYELKVKFRDRSGATIESETIMFEVTESRERVARGECLVPEGPDVYSLKNPNR